MNSTKTRNGFALASLLLCLAGCSGGGGRSPSELGGSGDFVLLRVTPPDNASLFLNDSIQFDFSTPVDLSSADLNSVAFTVFDLTGRPLGEQPRGTFRIATSPGDSEPGRRLEFVPVLPTDDLFSNGGFKAARRYVVQLVGGDRRNGVVLRDVRGRELETPVSFTFTTVDGSTPGELFRNTRAGGPRRVGFEVNPSTVLADGTRSVDPNFNNARDLEIRLTFDQPVNPQSTNVPTRIDLDPRRRDPRLRGRIYLEYDDPSFNGNDTWIPAEAVLERNELDGATVVLRPIGVLPNNAVVRVRVENTFEDMAGESNIGDAAYNSLFGSFVVEARHEPQFDAIIERFEGGGAVDLEAPFLEPVAELVENGLRASLAFEGEDATLDYEPVSPETILNTDFTRVELRSGRSLNVSGGVFQFRNVHIPRDYRVIGQGSKPMVWLVTGDMTIEGSLEVNGGDGEMVSSTSGEIPAAGGVGNCGGGRGGRGSVVTTGRTEVAETGFGPNNVAGGGGSGGRHSCLHPTNAPNCKVGSGGGGGSFATKGDPDFYTKFPRFRGTGTGVFDMLGGDGRQGCQNKAANNPGVEPGTSGPLGFIDADENNNFVGSAIRFVNGVPTQRVFGELAAPRGGAGGGGGGDGSFDCASATNWRTDGKGGGGGAGGGVLIIKCLGRVKIASTGRITANGGHGGGGYPNGTSYPSPTTQGYAGGGGGGGSGGMVVIMCSRLDIVQHGERYGQATTTTRHAGAYDFAIMADGGVGKRNPGPTGTLPIRGKYPTSFLSTDPNPENGQWHTDFGDRPTGGFGGNGVVQLMTPSANDADQTGSFFDDNIFFYANDSDLNANPPAPLPPAAKKELLGWRGYRSGTERVDDLGNTITIDENGFNIGDVKPAPILLPAPFGPVSRAMSRPIDLGRVDRIESSEPEGVRTIVPRGTSGGDPFTNLMAGPTFGFGGTEWASDSTYQGYVSFDASGAQTAPVVGGSNSTVAAVVADAQFNSRPAHRIDLAAANPLLAQIPGRYTGYMAQLFGGGTLLAELRVLGHDGERIWLDPASGTLPATTVDTVQLAAKFVVLETDGAPGLGPAVDGAPLSNVRIGFAFYRDPRDPGTRYPASGFEYGLDFSNTELLRSLRDGKYRYVQYDIQFNLQFSPGHLQTDKHGRPISPGNIDTTRKLRPTAPRPVVRELVLPFQF